jgi:manganese efflux pump family protein
MIHRFVVNAVLFLSLGLDTLGVAIGLGISGLSRRQRLRFGVGFALAEGIMPLVGFLLGKALAQAAGNVASYLAIALLLAVGLYMLRESTKSKREAQYEADTFLRLAVVAASVSMDELAVGFSLGLLGVPILLAALYIGLQAFVVTLVGTAIGRRVGELFAERAEMVAGIALTLLAFFLLGEKIANP